MKKVSIIVPMYNVEKYISNCIKSCINQTYSNIEIILIDDGSSDFTYNIAKSYSIDDKRIKLIQQKNCGVSVARNIGILKSTGDWILFLDGDDWLELDAVEKMINKIFNIDKEIDVLVMGFFSNYSNCEKKDYFLNINPGIINDNMTIVKNCICKNSLSRKEASANIGVPWAKLYNSSFLKNNNFEFKVGLKRMQDMIFNINVFYNSNTIYYDTIPVYHYRLQDSSVTNKYTQDFFDTSVKILCCINDFIEKYQLQDQLNDYYELKALKLFTEIIRLQYAPKENKKNIFKKVIELKKILDSDPYVNLLPIKKNELLNFKYIIVNFFIKFKFVFVVYILYKISYYKKNFRVAHNGGINEN